MKLLLIIVKELHIHTTNHPFFIEFASDTGKIARKKGLINIFVSNGYYTDETIKEVKKFLDCITIDIKGNGNLEFVRKNILIPSMQPVFDSLPKLKELHVEITDLIIPKIGDDIEDCKKMLKFLLDHFGNDLPIHFLRFFPNYKLLDLPPTPIKTLEKHYEIAREMGFNYVYIGNVWGHPYESTYCPECKNVVVGRYGFSITSWNLDEKNNCKFCGYKIKIFGKLTQTT